MADQDDPLIPDDEDDAPPQDPPAFDPPDYDALVREVLRDREQIALGERLARERAAEVRQVHGPGDHRLAERGRAERDRFNLRHQLRMRAARELHQEWQRRVEAAQEPRDRHEFVVDANMSDGESSNEDMPVQEDPQGDRIESDDDEDPQEQAVRAGIELQGGPRAPRADAPDEQLAQERAMRAARAAEMRAEYLRAADPERAQRFNVPDEWRQPAQVVRPMANMSDGESSDEDMPVQAPRADFNAPDEQPGQERAMRAARAAELRAERLGAPAEQDPRAPRADFDAPNEQLARERALRAARAAEMFAERLGAPAEQDPRAPRADFNAHEEQLAQERARRAARAAEMRAEFLRAADPERARRFNVPDEWRQPVVRPMARPMRHEARGILAFFADEDEELHMHDVHRNRRRLIDPAPRAEGGVFIPFNPFNNDEDLQQQAGRFMRARMQAGLPGRPRAPNEQLGQDRAFGAARAAERRAENHRVEEPERAPRAGSRSPGIELEQRPVMVDVAVGRDNRSQSPDAPNEQLAQERAAIAEEMQAGYVRVEYPVRPPGFDRDRRPVMRHVAVGRDGSPEQVQEQPVRAAYRAIGGEAPQRGRRSPSHDRLEEEVGRFMRAGGPRAPRARSPDFNERLAQMRAMRAARAAERRAELLRAPADNNYEPMARRARSRSPDYELEQVEQAAPVDNEVREDSPDDDMNLQEPDIRAREQVGIQDRPIVRRARSPSPDYNDHRVMRPRQEAREDNAQIRAAEVRAMMRAAMAAEMRIPRAPQGQHDGDPRLMRAEMQPWRQRERAFGLHRRVPSPPRDPNNWMGEEMLRNLIRARERWEEEHHQADLEDEMRAAVVGPSRRYPLRSGFPVVSTCEFIENEFIRKETYESHNGLKWKIRWSTHPQPGGIKFGRATMTFSGMGDNAYKIMVTLKSTDDDFIPDPETPDDLIIIDKDHFHIVYPNTLNGVTLRPGRSPTCAPEITLTIAVHDIQKIDSYQSTGQRWPDGSRWEIYTNVFNVLLNPVLLRAQHKELDKFQSDVRRRVCTVKEAQAFYDVLCLMCHRAFDMQDKYQEVMHNAFKMGFTEGWKEQDSPDTILDFYTRTMLPTYALLNNEEPYEQVLRVGEALDGICQNIKLMINPNVTYLRTQVEPMDDMKENKGQFDIFLEQSRHGTLLLAAVNLQLEFRQQVKMKVTLFDSGTVIAIQRTYRIVDLTQKTIKIVVSALSEEQIQSMIDGRMYLNVQIHLQNTECNFIHNYQYVEDVMSAYMMPGPVNAWLVCEDKRKIGVCKEHLANHSPCLEQLFYSTLFVDCGKNTVEVKASAEVVLDVLNIIYHRCHSVPLNRLQEVLALAGYWLASVVTRYCDMAILTTDLISVEEKVKLATTYNLDMCKFIMRHPEYHDTFKFELTEQQMQELENSKHGNELDWGREE